MAPRYPSYDYNESGDDFSLLDSSLEYKPRLDLWASQTAYQAWSEKTQEQKRRRQQQRTVRFAAAAMTMTTSIEYIHINDYTLDEKKACWFQRDEYQRIREHNDRTVTKMTSRLPLDEGVTESSTGLETRTPRENAISHQAIRQAIFAVLDEQDDQLRYNDGYRNEGVLAARYASYTLASQDRALWLGQAQAVY